MNAIFVANKPRFISSNAFLAQLKRKYGVKKAGFSGTLDPFATGALIIAFGKYTRLFKYIQKSQKTYIATIWLGAFSQSFDDENICEISQISPFDINKLICVKNSLLGEIVYNPPKFSAKKINGKRAYELARNDVEFSLKECKMTVFECEILHYFHPFLTIKISLSSGAYVRSFAQILAKKLSICATLCALKRISEGKFIYENEKFLNPLEYINLPKNCYLGEKNDIICGKKINKTKLEIQKNGLYLLEFEDFFSIIEICNENVKYHLNKVEKC